MIIKRKRQRITIAFGYHYILVKKLKFYPLIRSTPKNLIRYSLIKGTERSVYKALCLNIG